MADRFHICYLCGQEITDKKKSDLDHVPPRRIFAKSIRSEHPLELTTVRVHVKCNRHYKADEEYFFTTLVGHAVAHSSAGREAWKDLQASFRDPEHQGLLKKVIGEFGRLTLPGGKVAKFFDWPRLHRVTWKIVRGLYFVDNGQVLPEDTPKMIDIFPPERAPELPEYYPLVRDTESKARHRGVFDYKTVCVPDDDVKLRIYALLLWDAIIILVPFHDPIV